MVRFTPTLLGLALLLCSGASKASMALPDLVILPGSEASELLKQCSRSVPEKGEAIWMPNISQVRDMEKAVWLKLKSARPDVNWAKFPNGWVRNFVGTIRNGQKFIYGSYSPKPIGFDVCDGGPHFFGAEYGIDAKKITHIAFNGVG